MRALKIGVIMDPIEKIDINKDTTFVLMLEAQKRGHQIYYAGLDGLSIRGTIAEGRFGPIQVVRANPHYRLGTSVSKPLNWFDVVLMRKLYSLNFPELIPPTLVSGDREQLKGFMAEQGGAMIIKPLDGCGGNGVFYLDRKDKNTNAILETATTNGRNPIMAQRYLPEVRRGDKRIIVLDGAPLGAVLRVPRGDENRANIHAGGRVVKTTLTSRDREICRVLSPHLKKSGLYFVGLDVIGGYLTEVNVTSPTGVQEINALNNVRIERPVIDFIEKKAAQLRKSANRP